MENTTKGNHLTDLSDQFQKLSFSESTGHSKEDNAYNIFRAHHSIFRALMADHCNIFPWNCSDFLICSLSTRHYEARKKKKITKLIYIILSYLKTNENLCATKIFLFLFLGNLTVSTTLISLHTCKCSIGIITQGTLG